MCWSTHFVGFRLLQSKHMYFSATKFLVSTFRIIINLLLFSFYCGILTPSFFPADLYAFLVVFVLPLNSAVNPILYTFTTTKYRNQFLSKSWYRLTGSKSAQDGSGPTVSSSNQCKLISIAANDFTLPNSKAFSYSERLEKC